jgi:hypothetical protein
MAKARQTIVLTPSEAIRLRAKVADMADRALGVLDSELTSLAEAGMTYDEEGNPLSSLTEWAKTFKIVADQVRRDNPTEHLVDRRDDEPKPVEEKPKPSLKGVKLRIAE